MYMKMYLYVHAYVCAYAYAYVYIYVYMYAYIAGTGNDATSHQKHVRNHQSRRLLLHYAPDHLWLNGNFGHS